MYQSTALVISVAAFITHLRDCRAECVQRCAKKVLHKVVDIVEFV